MAVKIKSKSFQVYSTGVILNLFSFWYLLRNKKIIPFAVGIVHYRNVSRKQYGNIIWKITQDDSGLQTTFQPSTKDYPCFKEEQNLVRSRKWERLSLKV